MVEMEAADIAVIPAQVAASPGIGYEDLLQLLAASNDGRLATAHAPVATAAFLHEVGETVVTALELNDPAFRLGCGLPAAGAL